MQHPFPFDPAWQTKYRDMIATPAEAVGRLVARQGAELVAYSFLVELSFLNGARRLGGEMAAGSGQPRFVPMELPPALWTTDVRIELPGGAVVRLPQGVSAELLAAAVRASCGSEVPEGKPSC